MKNSKFIILFNFLLIVISCQNKNKEAQLKEVAKLPKELKEISGLTFMNNSFWAVADSGNKNCVYQLDENGKIVHTIAIENLENKDWEDITKDENGNLYIGDFGNNDNVRKDLGIYKVNSYSLRQAKINTAQATTFYYPEQNSFPPKKNELLYDCEGFFELDGFFYLFTKNRSKGFDGTTLLYKIPNQSGHFKAELFSKYKTCSTYNFCAITSAAISPSKKSIALLSHDKIYILENSTDDKFSSTIKTIELHHNSQKESLCFKNDTTLIIADEKVKKNGGKLYEFSFKN